MNKYSFIGVLGLALFSLSTSAFQPSGTLGSLVQETRQFKQLIRSKGAAPRLERAAARLGTEVRQLRQCVRRKKGGNGMGVRRIPRGCRSELQDVRRVVSRIDGMGIRKRTLRHQFRQVKRAAAQLRVAQGGGGGGHPKPHVKCIAVDNGWEEHFGGHVAYGRGIRNAQRAALRLCESVHGSCRILRCE